MPDERLRGQVAVITGASSGIGAALARELATGGCRLALVARREEMLQALADELEAAGAETLVVSTDVCEDPQVDCMVKAVLDRWGRVDILVANSGIYVQAPAQRMTVEDLERSMSVNVFGAARVVFAFLPTMLAQGSGTIALMSSQDALIPIPEDGPYVASKYALDGLGQVLRQELRPCGIHVMVIYPGRIDTPLIDHLRMPAISPKVAPDRLARRIVRAIVARRRSVIYPASGHLYLLRALWPALGDWLIHVFNLKGWRQSADACATRKDAYGRS